jgi:hypothetical protein
MSVTFIADLLVATVQGDLIPNLALPFLDNSDELLANLLDNGKRE